MTGIKLMKIFFTDPRPPPRLEPVVGTTPQLQVGHVCLTTIGKWDHVVIFEESSLSAPARGPDERTSASIAGPHLALHARRHVPAGVRGSVCRARPRRSGMPGSAKLG